MTDEKSENVMVALEIAKKTRQKYAKEFTCKGLAESIYSVLDIKDLAHQKEISKGVVRINELMDANKLLLIGGSRLEAEIKRLQEALEAIRIAPGGGPGKRIATMALKQAEDK